jgi:hypothetical protein
VKYLSLILALIGLFLLSLLLISQKPIPISSLSELEKQQENQKVTVSGYVIQEKFQKSEKILTLDNNIKALCNNPCPDYLYKNISIEGIYDTFIEPRVIASTIKVNP